MPIFYRNQQICVRGVWILLIIIISITTTVTWWIFLFGPFVHPNCNKKLSLIATNNS
jgi:hypothetical protein